MNQAWKALDSLQEKTGRSYYTALRYQADHSKLNASRIAEQLGGSLGKKFTTNGMHCFLHRARETFAALVLKEVEWSLQDPGQAELQAELSDLELLALCRQAWSTARKRPHIHQAVGPWT